MSQSLYKGTHLQPLHKRGKDFLMQHWQGASALAAGALASVAASALAYSSTKALASETLPEIPIDHRGSPEYQGADIASAVRNTGEFLAWQGANALHIALGTLAVVTITGAVGLGIHNRWRRTIRLPKRIGTNQAYQAPINTPGLQEYSEGATIRLHPQEAVEQAADLYATHHTLKIHAGAPESTPPAYPPVSNHRPTAVPMRVFGA